MAELKRGAIGALALATTALGGAALVSLSAGPAAHAFTFTWGGEHHHEQHPDDAPYPERRFTFPWAAHVDPMNGNFAAKQFVEKRLTPGLPMSEAVARVRAARAACDD